MAIFMPGPPSATLTPLRPAPIPDRIALDASSYEGSENAVKVECMMA
jgi:hypothetical protein